MDLYFAVVYFFIDVRFWSSISRLREILHHAQECVRFYNAGLNFFVSSPPKNLKGQKRAKFGPILDDFKLRRRISPELRKISKIGKVHDQQ